MVWPDGLSEVGEVAGMAHPGRALGFFAKARMIGHDDVEPRRQRLVERQFVEGADIMVQHQNRAARATAADPHVQPA